MFIILLFVFYISCAFFCSCISLLMHTVMLNRYFPVCHYISLDISFPYFLKNIFFVVSLGITINILIYTTLILIKASLISIVLKKTLPLYSFIHSLCTCAIVVIQITSLPIICP